MKLVKLKDQTKMVNVGDSVWLLNSNDRTKNGREAFITKIGSKLFSLSYSKDGQGVAAKFDFDGFEQGNSLVNSVYSSREAYLNRMIQDEFLYKLSITRNHKKTLTPDQISMVAKLLDMDKELEESREKIKNKIEY